MFILILKFIVLACEVSSSHHFGRNQFSKLFVFALKPSWVILLLLAVICAIGAQDSFDNFIDFFESVGLEPIDIIFPILMHLNKPLSNPPRFHLNLQTSILMKINQNPPNPFQLLPKNPLIPDNRFHHTKNTNLNITPFRIIFKQI